MEKKIRIVDNSVQVLDNEIKNKINSINISPSAVGSWLSSPGDYIIDKFIAPEVQKEEQIYFIRGTWFHSIMEDFFKKPGYERTFDGLKESLNRVTSSNDDFKALIDKEENKEWLTNAIRGYWETWGKDQAKDEKIAKLFLMGEQKDGLELFVNGKIGNASRRCLGFIDRLIEGNGGLKVQDWKTGKHVASYDPNKPISDYNSFDYWRQQLFYTILLEDMGLVVTEASLVFPCADPPTEVFIDVFSQEARNQVVKDVEQMDLELTQCITNDYKFPLKKGRWNSWASWLCGLGNARKPDNIYEDQFLMITEIL